ncbi:MAG: hypothetical protein VYC91_04150 [Acidobacteriota bacterium]|nr:hypothetical protein [Acidobacteriota bacterium]
MSFYRTIVTLVLFLFMALPGTAQTLSSADSLAVFDVTGKRVGALQGIDDGKVYIVLQKDGLLLSLEMEPGQIKGIGGPVRFESKDCSGQPYIEDLGKIFPGTEFVNSTVFVADLSVPSRVVITFSSLNQSDGSCVKTFAQEDFFPALEFPDLLAHITSPYRVQVDTQNQAGPPSFPALIRGAGSSSQLVVGAGDTAISIDSSFHAPDGSLITTQSITVPPNGTSLIDFEGTDLESGSLVLAVDPSDAHVLSTEIISLAGVPSLGVLPAPLCTRPEFLMKESSNSRTAGAFSNPSSVDIATCSWEVFSGEGISSGGGSFTVQPLGQVQFFPDEKTTLTEGFLGSFKATCDSKVHIFSLFQKSDGTLTSNAAGCGEQ